MPLKKINNYITFCLDIYQDTNGYYKYSGDKNKQFRQALWELNEAAMSHSAAIRFVRIKDLLHGGEFSRYFDLVANDERLHFQEVKRPLSSSVVVNRKKDELFDNANFDFANWHTYNSHEVAQFGNKKICMDKFGQYMPVSFYFDCSAGAAQAAEELFRTSSMLVYKPLRSNGGEGIEFINPDTLGSKLSSVNKPAIIQEFVETIGGIPGMVNGRHDFRLYIIDGSIVAASIRQPLKGKLLANTSAGGSMDFIAVEDVPGQLKTTSAEICRKVSAISKNHFISLDFFYSGTAWYLIEINDQPGVPARYQTKDAAGLQIKCIESIMEHGYGYSK